LVEITPATGVFAPGVLSAAWSGGGPWSEGASGAEACT